MRYSILRLLLAALLSGGVLTGCNKTVAPAAAVSKINKSNYDQIRTGMTKSQVEAILGPPTSVETKDLVIYKRTTYHYQEGSVFVNISFKNDELDSKDSNLGTVTP
ncbi:MAG: outer membrane protein assembly factor BamE [Verrucomicrobia bacterium]|nr:outer membrane protein assembly factor BamE [Verrucomicrobiota bacterium]